MAEVTHYPYQVGGSLPIDASTYVVREADTMLLNALLARQYCYILNARQMGKSSLRARTMQRLREHGIVSAEIELSGIGSQEITAHQWYGGIIWELASGFSLTLNRRQWLREHDHLSPIQRLGTFIETVLLTQVAQPMVIFFDEIDHILGLEFSTDDFFGLVRHWHEKRAADERYRRLSVVLLGAASPANLIHNKARATPFNIGLAIPLKGFQPHEVSPLTAGFAQDVKNPSKLLQIILTWTGGQPFLTQKVCHLVRQQLDKRRTDEIKSDEIKLSKQQSTVAGKLIDSDELRPLVDNLVKQQIIDRWETHDEPEHLRTIRDRILYPIHSQKRRLTLYQRILHQGHVQVRPQQLDQLELSLTGVIMEKSGQWIVKNAIYRTIFNPAWVEHLLTERSISTPAQPSATQLYPRAPRFTRRIITSISLLATIATLGFRFTGLLQPWELKAFDQLMQLRPTEAADPRLLIIEVTETDVQAQQLSARGASSLSDQALNQLRSKLLRTTPRAIGLDIYREQPTTPDYPQLADWIKHDPRFFAICKYGDPGVPPSPEIPLERHGFNNILEDNDGVLRRYPLAVADSYPCDNAYALSWLLATHYLEPEGITPQFTPDGYLQLGETIFKPVMPNFGGYQSINASGHQVMINYRATPIVAHTITLGDFLSDRTQPDIARDRIVIIGTSAPSFNDHRWITPHSQTTEHLITLSGLEIQAHLVSQILSATLDQRPLIWSWPIILESLWTGCWALTGSILAQHKKPRWIWLITLSSTIVILIAICWQLLLFGGWLPLVPGGLALIISSSSTRFILKIIEKRTGHLAATILETSNS